MTSIYNNNNSEYVNVKLKREAYEEYSRFCKAVRLAKLGNEITLELSELLREGTRIFLEHAIARQKEGYNTHSPTEIIPLRISSIAPKSELADKFASAFCVEDIDPETFKIKLEFIKSFIIKNTGLKTMVSVNLRKQELFTKFSLKQVQIGREHWVVHKTCSLEELKSTLEYNRALELKKRHRERYLKRQIHIKNLKKSYNTEA